MSVTVADASHEAEAGFDLADNQWHDVDVRFHERQLQVRLDGLWTGVANASDVDASALFARSVGDNSEESVTIGRGFAGCLLEGPSLLFTTFGQDLLVDCPIPSANCSESAHSDCHYPIIELDSPRFETPLPALACFSVNFSKVAHPRGFHLATDHHQSKSHSLCK